MKTIFMNIRKKRVVSILLPSVFLLCTMCLTITTVTQPTTVTVGESFTVTVDVDMAPAEDNTGNLVFGFLAPVDWNVATNATASYTSENGDGTMRLTTASDFEPQSFGEWGTAMKNALGIGENYGEVEWVTFISDTPITVANAANFSGQVILNVTVSDKNVTTQLGYSVATSNYGLDDSHSVKFTDCMSVTGGTESLGDLCGPRPFPVVVTPEIVSINDIITISFDGTKNDALLEGADAVYICGSAMVDGQPVSVCEVSSKTMLTNLGDDQWEIKLWPNGFFGASANAIISDLTFNFTNEAQDIIVYDPNTSTDFVFTPTCN